jgi:cytochrome P450
MTTTTADPDLVASFDALLAGTPGLDPVPVYRRMRAEAPMMWDERMGVWVVSRHEDIARVLREEHTFSPLTGGRGTPLFGRTILQMKGREHAAKSSIVAQRIRAPKALANLHEGVAAVSRRLADALPTGVPVDLREGFTTWLPLTVITDLLDVEEGRAWREWYDLMAAGGVSSITGDDEARARGIAARNELFEYVRPLLDERRTNPGDDLLSDLVTRELDGHRMSEEEVLSFTAFLLTAGVETTDRVLSSLLRHVLLHPDVWAEVRADRGLVLPMCAEALRMFPPVQGLTRQVLEPTELHGQALREGDLLVILLASGNRDEDVFVAPDTFDVRRFSANPEREFTGAGSILTFGGGRHHCTGAALARTEMEIGLTDLLDRFATMAPAGELPPPQGFILRSPAAVPAILEQA